MERLRLFLVRSTFNNALNYGSFRSQDVQKLRFCLPVSFTLATSQSRTSKEVI